MNLGKALFAPVMDFLPWKASQRIADRYGADYRVGTLPGTERFRVMALAQLAYRERLRGIETCLVLSMFAWAAFRSTTAPVKAHTLLDLLRPAPEAFYLIDRDYLDCARWCALNQVGIFFVTRARRYLNARRPYFAAVDRSKELICDQTTVALHNFSAAKDYPAHLRHIRYRDPDTDKSLVFLTHHTLLPASTICALYKSRWQMELFFR